MLVRRPAVLQLPTASPVTGPVVSPRGASLGRRLLSWRSPSRWLLLNYPLLWRARPGLLLAVAVAGHLLAGWLAWLLPASVLWDGELQFHLVPLAYAWALTLAIFIPCTRRMVVYRDAGRRPRQRLATLALSLAAVLPLCWPADRFQQVVMRRQVAAVAAEDVVLVRRLAALQNSLLNLASEPGGPLPGCAGWPADWTAPDAAGRLNDLLRRNRLDGSLDAEDLAAAIAGQPPSCGGVDTPTVDARAFFFLRLPLERPSQLADVWEQLEASDWHSLAANHVMALGMVPVFWLALILMSQPRRPVARRWLSRLSGRVSRLARWPRLPLLGRLEDYLLRNRPAWWALWPLRLLLLATLICLPGAALSLWVQGAGAGTPALLFGGLMYLVLGISLALHCHQLPLHRARLRRPSVFALLVLTTLLPVLPFEGLVLGLGASAGVGAAKGGAAMLAIALYYVTPHLLTACLVMTVVRIRVAVVVVILGVLVMGVVAAMPEVHGAFLAGWLASCAALAVSHAVLRLLGLRLTRALLLMVLTLAPAALVAGMMLALEQGLAADDALGDLWILAVWWLVLWLGPVRGRSRVLDEPADR